MQQVLQDLPLTLAYIGADLVALAILVGALYIPRHGRRDLVAAYIGVNVGLCTPPLPSVENLGLTVDGWWRQSVDVSPEALDPTSTIRTTMVLHGYDIYSRPLTTGRTGRRRLSAPSPGDEDAEFTLSDAPVRRVATSSEHPANSRDRR